MALSTLRRLANSAALLGEKSDRSDPTDPTDPTGELARASVALARASAALARADADAGEAEAPLPRRPDRPYVRFRPEVVPLLPLLPLLPTDPASEPVSDPASDRLDGHDDSMGERGSIREAAGLCEETNFGSTDFSDPPRTYFTSIEPSARTTLIRPTPPS